MALDSAGLLARLACLDRDGVNGLNNPPATSKGRQVLITQAKNVSVDGRHAWGRNGAAALRETGPEADGTNCPASVPRCAGQLPNTTAGTYSR